MKKTTYIHKVFIALTMVGFLSACDLDLLDNPNAVTPDNASIELLMNNVFIETGEWMHGDVQFWDGVNDRGMTFTRLSAMFGSKFYDQEDGPESYDFIWAQAYSTLLPDLNVVIDRAEADGITTYSGVAKVLKAYVLFSLVDMFGDVPYSDALQGTDKLSPTLDDDASVYAEGLALLNSAIADLSDPKGANVANDLFYGGNVSKWLKAANSLKLRYYVTTRLVDNNALTQVNTLAGDESQLIVSSSDDWDFHWGGNREAPDSRHPFYSDGYEAGGPYWYQSNYRMWTMFGEKETEDPRIRYYYYRQDCDETDEDFFTLQCQAQPYPFHWPAGWPYCTASSDWGDPNMEYGGYWGRDHGDDAGLPPDDLKKTAWGVYPAGGKFDADNCTQVSNSGTDGLKGVGITPFLTAYNVLFMIGEAKLAGNDAAAARDYLERAVRVSIEKVMAFGAADAGNSEFIPSDAQIEAYVAEVLALYDAAPDNDAKMNVLMKEAWLAMQTQGLEAYNAYRRTCKPTGMQISLEPNSGAFPRSYWYPANFVNRNENVTQKSNLEVRVFWDTNTCTLQ